MPLDLPLNSIKKIVITPGEPAGIGPDLIIKLAREELFLRDISAELVVVADQDLLIERSVQLSIPFSFSPYNKKDRVTPSLKIAHVSVKNRFCCGTPDRDNVAYVLETLRIAAKGAMSGEFDALVTGPLHKGIINDVGTAFTGHTEFFAKLSEIKRPVMMLQTKGLRVALVTTHLPLAQVSQAITKESLIEVITILHHGLTNRFGIRNPKIYICGLNPHAGEGGHLGREEIELIAPVINMLKKKGMNLIGPLPADTLFTEQYLKDADVVLAMYHDQGLPVLKYKGFGRAVNITLGLPFIRTSVDHGTALDIAGTGKADISSLKYAISTAIELATVRDASLSK